MTESVKFSTQISRRGVLGKIGGTGFIAAIGAPIPFLKFLPQGVSPIALAQGSRNEIAEKEELTLLSDRPLNMETPAHLLDDNITPASRFFVRNNGIPPFLEDISVDSWRLSIDGEVDWSAPQKVVHYLS